MAGNELTSSVGRRSPSGGGPVGPGAAPAAHAESNQHAAPNHAIRQAIFACRKEDPTITAFAALCAILAREPFMPGSQVVRAAAHPAKVFSARTGTGQLTTNPSGWVSGVPLNSSTSPAAIAACTSSAFFNTRGVAPSCHMRVK